MKNRNSMTHIFSVHINNFEKDLCIISFTDISETMIEQQKLEEKVNIDKLTNAFNREYFENNIENIINENYKNHLETAVVMVDIDFFKKVNDTYGHDVGDEVLKDFVDILKLNSRFHDDVLIRWGGEEFLMIVSIKDKNTLLNVLEKYRDAIEKHNFPIVGKITCSIGASIYNNSKSIKDTIKESDVALYEAKTSGRNKAVLF
jgi:diguanylate cyclase (GGDEF)-like protein